jgi:WD40 repeat protein
MNRPALSSPVAIAAMFAAGAVLALGQAPALAQIDAGFPHSQFKVPLPMMQRGVVPGVEGKMGQIVYDQRSKRLVFAATRSGSLEIFDNSGIKVVQSIKDLPEPRGLAIEPKSGILLVTCGDGSVRLFTPQDNGEFKTPGLTVQLRGEATSVRLEPDGKRAWIAHGKFVTPLKLPLTPADTPEPGASIELPDRVDGLVVHADRVYASIGKRGEIVVLDRADSKRLATWTPKHSNGLGSLAIDPARKRLFAAARDERKLLVLDLADGKELTRLETPADPETVAYDPEPGNRIYVTCGSGKVLMVRQTPAKDPAATETYTIEHIEPTMAGAGTSLLLNDKRKLIVTAPKLGDAQPCFIYVYILPP